jgi:STE24 endopeptidase
MNVDEVLAVLAHEIGHYRKRHIWVNMALGTLQSAIILFIFGKMASSIELSIALGYNEASEPIFHLALIAFGILFSPIENVLGVISNAISRKMEYQADAFASRYGYGESLVKGLKNLSAENLSNLTPHPAYVFVNYSHPSLFQRVKKILG